MPCAFRSARAEARVPDLVNAMFLLLAAAKAVGIQASVAVYDGLPETVITVTIYGQDTNVVGKAFPKSRGRPNKY